MVWCGALTGGNGNEGPTDLDGEGISFFNFEGQFDIFTYKLGLISMTY